MLRIALRVRLRQRLTSFPTAFAQDDTSEWRWRFRLMRANTVRPYVVMQIDSLLCTKPSPVGEGGSRRLTDEVFPPASFVRSCGGECELFVKRVVEGADPYRVTAKRPVCAQPGVALASLREGGGTPLA